MDVASNDVRDRIELAKRVLPDIPDEMDNPYIFKFNTAMIPIFVMGVTAKESYPDLYDLIDKRVGDVLRQVPGVGTIDLQGGLRRQINIWLDRQRLEGYGFYILDIQNALKQENVTQPVGSLKSGFTDYLVRLPGEFTTPEEISLVILGGQNGKYVYLKDVARVEDGFQEIATDVRIKERPGLIMMIQKQNDANTVEVARGVLKKLKEVEKTLPSDIKIFTLFDTSKDIVDSLASLKSSAWTGIILVVIVVWFFLRQFLPSLIIALTIPFSLMISFVYLFLSGKTINTISLSSLAIAVGMVVDNAIVVVDNVYRRLERGNRPSEAAIFGTNEMLLAIGASTLTTVVVFLPMLFITGVVGIMFAELAVVVSVTLLASFFTAVTFTPMLASKWMGRTINAKRKIRFFNKLYDLSEKMFRSWEDFYALSLGWCLRHKKTVIIGFFIAFVLSLGLTRFVGNEFIPEEDTGDLRITVNLRVGTRLEETEKVAGKIEEVFRSDVPEAEIYFVRSGSATGVGRTMGQGSGSHIACGGAKLVPKTKRKRSAIEVAQAVRTKIRQIPGVEKVDITTGNPIGRMITGLGGKAVRAEIVGHSFEQTNELAQKIKALIEKIPGAVDVSVSRDMNLPELRIEVDREKSASLGLTMNTIASSLKTYIQGSTATKYREKGETYDVYVRLEELNRQNIEDIENLFIVAPLPTEKESFAPLAQSSALKGVSRSHIKLSNIAKILEVARPIEIERQNRERLVHVDCNIYKRSMGKFIEDVKSQIKKMTIPSDIIINFGGEAEEQGKAFKDLFLLLMLGIALVYMVMAAQFESLLDPFIIMFSIPFTFIGVILGFLITNQTLNIISYLGIIMLMGIVVNNAIVLISYIIMLRARGFSMYDAVTNAGRERLRPVLMTTITTLVGLLPLAISRGEGSEIWQPLGVTMFGGLLVSTLITMLYVHTLYAVFHRKSALKEEEAKPHA